MADVEKFMSVDAGDIEKIMGVAVGDIEAVMGLGIVTFVNDQWFGSRHLINGHSADLDRISYKSSTSDGNVSDFGNLIIGSHSNAGSGTGNGKARGIAGGRYDHGSSATSKAIDYYATATTGNASDFGDNDTYASEAMGMSNGTLLFMAGGGYPYVDRMEYVTIATTGNGTDAGNIDMGLTFQGASVSGNTRGAIFGGSSTDESNSLAVYERNTVDYITFHTSNNSADFGDLSLRTMSCTACASSTRWVMKAGFTNVGPGLHINMDYFTADTLGNYSDFGDIADRTRSSSGMADGTRGEFWGGYDATPSYGNLDDSIAYITIASAGDGTDAGNLHATGRMMNVGLSGAAS